MKNYVQRYAALGIALILGSCTAQAQQQTPPNAAAPPAAPPATITTEARSGGRFKMQLTLDSPGDLKVSEGDSVVPGQIVADRVNDRTKLQFQRESIMRELVRLRKLAALPMPDVKPLPSASFAEESAGIERLRHKVEEAQKRREQQQRKVDLIATMPSSDVPEAIAPHEQILLEQREREYNTAIAEVELARGRLDKAKEQRQLEEYSYSLEMSKRAIAIREHELKTQGQITDLEARLSQVEVALSQLSAVRSPYGGRVQRVRFEGQSDQNLRVELVLVVAGDMGRPGTAADPPVGDDGGNGDRDTSRPE